MVMSTFYGGPVVVEKNKPTYKTRFRSYMRIGLEQRQYARLKSKFDHLK